MNVTFGSYNYVLSLETDPAIRPEPQILPSQSKNLLLLEPFCLRKQSPAVVITPISYGHTHQQPGCLKPLVHRKRSRRQAPA